MKNIILLFVSFCMLSAAGCSSSTNSDSESGPNAMPSLTNGSQPITIYEPETINSESETLADLILFETDNLLLEEETRNALIQDMDRGLDLIRENEQEKVGNISVRPPFEMNRLILNVEFDLFETIANVALNEQIAVFETGFKGFDDLNSLAAADSFYAHDWSFGSYISIWFDAGINLAQAREKYNAIDEIVSAEFNHNGGDESNIRAEKVNDITYFVFMRGNGDCPSGCIYEAYFYFSVDASGYQEFDENDAMKLDVFTRLKNKIYLNNSL